MSIWKNFWAAVTEHPAGASDDDVAPQSLGPLVNPVTGLPMLGNDSGGVDVGGSPFGIDIHAQFDSHEFDSGVRSIDFEL